MIQYTTTINSLYDFSFWGGAEAWFKCIVEEGGNEAVDFLDEYLSDYGSLTKTDINDFIWFDAYDFLIENGYIKENNEDEQF